MWELLAFSAGLLGIVGGLWYWKRIGDSRRGQRLAQPFIRLGFVPITDSLEDERLQRAARKVDSEGAVAWYLVRLRGTVGGAPSSNEEPMEVIVTLQEADAWASKREVGSAPAVSLQTRINRPIESFRIGPPLPLGMRPIEKGLRAPLSGFADAGLEKTWFLYSGSIRSAESSLPRSILDDPQPEEFWMCDGGVLRLTSNVDLTDETAAGALARLRMARDHVCAGSGLPLTPRTPSPRSA